MIKRIYLDHSATTYLDKRVKRVMDLFWEKNFGNPSALYEEGRRAKKALDQARADIASVIGARPEEIIFTGGGTESDNLAIFGVVKALENSASKQKKHIITTKIEHHAILNAVKNLEEEDFKATYLNVDENGLVDPIDVKQALRPETVLVSVMYANNEIGAIQPIAEISEIIKEYRKNKTGIREKTPFFHSDACQAAGYLEMDVEKLGVDLMTISGHKIYGPKGIGALYVREGVEIQPLAYGGEQEYGMRPGTEGVPLIVGFGRAAEITAKWKSDKNNTEKISKLRDYLIEKLLKIPKVQLNGSRENRLPNNVNIALIGRDNDMDFLLISLFEKGICVSSGAACGARGREPSYVIFAVSRDRKRAVSSLRVTLGRKTNKKEIDLFLEKLIGTLA